jgi:enoyl-CoA hydratase
MSVIEVTHQAGVALVTLNRPEANNALNRELSEAIIQTFSSLACDDSVRAIVLTGAGRAFCAGVDLKAPGDNNNLGDKLCVKFFLLLQLLSQ